MAGLYWQQFEEGKVFRHPFARSVTQFDNTWHTCMTLNTQPLHLDLDFSVREGMYGKPLFNSIYTLAIVLGQTVTELTQGTLVEMVGMTDIQFPRPVFDGDTLRSRSTVVGVTPDEAGGTGVVELMHEGFNQHEELVATCRRWVRLRGTLTAAAA